MLAAHRLSVGIPLLDLSHESAEIVRDNLSIALFTEAVYAVPQWLQILLRSSLAPSYGVVKLQNDEICFFGFE